MKHFIALALFILTKLHASIFMSTEAADAAMAAASHPASIYVGCVLVQKPQGGNFITGCIRLNRDTILMSSKAAALGKVVRAYFGSDLDVLLKEYSQHISSKEKFSDSLNTKLKRVFRVLSQTNHPLADIAVCKLEVFGGHSFPRLKIGPAYSYDERSFFRLGNSNVYARSLRTPYRFFRKTLQPQTVELVFPDDRCNASRNTFDVPPTKPRGSTIMYFQNKDDAGGSLLYVDQTEYGESAGSALMFTNSGSGLFVKAGKTVELVGMGHQLFSSHLKEKMYKLGYVALEPYKEWIHKQMAAK